MITWLLTVAGNELYIVFITVLVVRMSCLYFLDSAENAASRPWFRFCLQSLALTITDSAWMKDEMNPVASSKCFITLCVLTSVENIFAVAWAAFLTEVWVQCVGLYINYIPKI